MKKKLYMGTTRTTRSHTKSNGCVASATGECIAKNSQLIASAPDLYEALKEVRRYATDVASLNSTDSQVIAGMCYVALVKAEGNNE